MTKSPFISRFVRLLAPFALVAEACSPTDQPSTIHIGQPSAHLDVEVTSSSDVEDFGRPPVTVTWAEGRSADAVVASDILHVSIDNGWDEDVLVELWLNGQGLDQRVVQTGVGAFRMEAKQSRSVRVPLSSIPVQSVGAPSQVDLVGTVTGPDWQVRLSTDSLYVQFTDDFRTAYVSAISSWIPSKHPATTPNAG